MKTDYFSVKDTDAGRTYVQNSGALMSECIGEWYARQRRGDYVRYSAGTYFSIRGARRAVAEKYIRWMEWEPIFESSFEPGADGKPQLVIPGAERIQQGKLAKRRADEPLKASEPQNFDRSALPLFSDSYKQMDLFK